MSAAPGIVDALLPVTDSILAIRDLVGAIIQPISFMKRTWFQDKHFVHPALAPEGFALDVVTRLLPTPGMKNFSQDIRLKEGGAVKAGDIILTNISKNKFALADLDGTSSAPNVQHFYMIGVKLYQVINVTEKYITWDVQIRELSNQTRY